MRPWPNAEFFRLWGVGLLLAFVVCKAFLSMPAAHAATMRASFYGAESGRFNADGSRFEPMGFTAASKSLPFGTRLEVCLVRCAIVTVRDRGPYIAGRALDLALGAARAIGLEARGVADVSVRRIEPSSARFAQHHDRDGPRRRGIRDPRRSPNRRPMNRAR